jgi:hypothetical protein
VVEIGEAAKHGRFGDAGHLVRQAGVAGDRRWDGRHCPIGTGWGLRDRLLKTPAERHASVLVFGDGGQELKSDGCSRCKSIMTKTYPSRLEMTLIRQSAVKVWSRFEPWSACQPCQSATINPTMHRLSHHGFSPGPPPNENSLGVVTNNDSDGRRGASSRSHGIIARELVGRFRTSQLSICLLSKSTY